MAHTLTPTNINGQNYKYIPKMCRQNESLQTTVWIFTQCSYEACYHLYTKQIYTLERSIAGKQWPIITFCGYRNMQYSPTSFQPHGESLHSFLVLCGARKCVIGVCDWCLSYDRWYNGVWLEAGLIQIVHCNGEHTWHESLGIKLIW